VPFSAYFIPSWPWPLTWGSNCDAFFSVLYCIVDVSLVKVCQILCQDRVNCILGRTHRCTHAHAHRTKTVPVSLQPYYVGWRHKKSCYSNPKGSSLGTPPNLVEPPNWPFQHKRRSSVNFVGARHFCPKIYAWKINKIPEFYMIYVRKKSTKCPNFTWFLPEKYFFPNLGEDRLIRLCFSVKVKSSSSKSASKYMFVLDAASAETADGPGPPKKTWDFQTEYGEFQHVP